MMRRMKELTRAAAVVAVGATTPSVPIAAATPPDAPQGPFKLGAGRVTSLQIYRVTSC